MSTAILIYVPERVDGKFTGHYSYMMPEDALVHLAKQVARRHVPLPILHYEIAEMILVFAQHMSVADADKLSQAFGSFPTLEALRASLSEIEARMYHEEL